MVDEEEEGRTFHARPICHEQSKEGLCEWWKNPSHCHLAQGEYHDHLKLDITDLIKLNNDVLNFKNTLDIQFPSFRHQVSLRQIQIKLSVQSTCHR